MQANASITMDVPSYIKVASNPARVVGLNSVGMERGGIDQETITILKKHIKLSIERDLILRMQQRKLNLWSPMIFKKSKTLSNSIKSSERGILR